MPACGHKGHDVHRIEARRGATGDHDANTRSCPRPDKLRLVTQPANIDDLVITTLAERPHLRPLLPALGDSVWPAFMRNDPTASLAYATFAHLSPELALVVTLPDEPSRPVAKALAVPWCAAGDGRDDLPDGGWDELIRWSSIDRLLGRPPTSACALEIGIHPDLRGIGLSSRLVAGLRHAAASAGLDRLVAPVRPSGKHLEPHEPMSSYVARRREDGLLHDPWLRVHERAGARVDRIAEQSMVIVAPLDDWRGWTGLPFTGDEQLVEQALVPVTIDQRSQLGIYVEPNVWMIHELA